MFELDQFVAGCRAALTADPIFELMREIVARSVSTFSAMIQRFWRAKASWNATALLLGGL
jgi:hypothetical protein